MKKIIDKIPLIIVILSLLFINPVLADDSDGSFDLDYVNDAPSFSAWYDSTTLIQPEHNVTFEVTIQDIDNTSGELTVYLWYSSDIFGVSNISQIMYYSSNPSPDNYEFVYEMDGTGKVHGTYYSYYYNVYDGYNTIYQPTAYVSGIFFDIQWDNPPSDGGGVWKPPVEDILIEDFPDVMIISIPMLVISVVGICIIFVFFLVNKNKKQKDLTYSVINYNTYYKNPPK